MNYPISVFDLDGTLTNSKKEITPGTREALRRYQEAGGIVVLASGRPTPGVLPVAKELELDKTGGYILAFNGGFVQDCRTGEIIYKAILPEGIPQRMYDFAKAHDVKILTYEENVIITEDPEDIYTLQEQLNNNMEIQKVDSFKDYVRFPVEKCLITGEPNHLAGVEKILNAEVGEILSVYRADPYFLEVMPKGIEKASSLQRLLDHLGMTREEMAAFGDGFNDIGMIKFAGLGVAMANAQDVVKKEAQHITLSNEEDGVACVLHKFVDGTFQPGC